MALRVDIPCNTAGGEMGSIALSNPGQHVSGITQAQKQALIDNLQLEITERARKLRAQYTLQAQGLRARLEMRINRIPQALRKRNMQDLFDEHSRRTRPAPSPPASSLPAASQLRIAAAPQPVKERGMKRPSEVLSQDEDKENAVTSQQQSLDNPKKRAKTAAVNSKTTRAVSRNAQAPTVLSPRSHNSRTLPRSPLRTAPGGTRTGHNIKPGSPIKLLVQHPAPSETGSRAASRQVRRGGNATDTEGRSSEASATSASTTIVTKATTKKATTASRKPPAVRPAAAAKKGTAAPPPASGGRSLRKRA